VGGAPVVGAATASGPVDALTRILSERGWEVEVLSLAAQSVGEGGDGRAITFAQCRIDGTTRWGVGLDSSVTASALESVLAAVTATG